MVVLEAGKITKFIYRVNFGIHRKIPGITLIIIFAKIVEKNLKTWKFSEFQYRSNFDEFLFFFVWIFFFQNFQFLHGYTQTISITIIFEIKFRFRFQFTWHDTFFTLTKTEWGSDWRWDTFTTGNTNSIVWAQEITIETWINDSSSEYVRYRYTLGSIIRNFKIFILRQNHKNDS